MPFFYSYIGSAGVLLVNGSLIILISIFLFLKNGFRLVFECEKGRKIALNYLIPLFLYLLLLPISMVIGVLGGGINLVERDFFEFYRPVFYILVFIFSYLYFSYPHRFEFFEKILVFIFIVVVLFGLNQFFRFFDGVSELYTKYHNIKTLRVSTPFTNPYDYAFFMSFFVYYFFVKALFDRFYYSVFFLIAVVILILPQSRSVVAGFLIGFFVFMPILLTYYGFNFKYLKLNKKIMLFYIFIIAVFVVLLALIPFLLENFGYLTGQFVRLLESGEIGSSAGARVDQFLFALDKALNNPLILLFGNGPAKDEMEYVESIYNYLFYRYGVSGVFIYFFILLLSIMYLFKILKQIGHKSKQYALFLAILLWFVTIPFLSIGNNFTEQVRTSFFYYTLLGLVAASYYRIVLKGSN